jgi:hypothetical protein
MIKLKSMSGREKKNSNKMLEGKPEGKRQH